MKPRPRLVRARRAGTNEQWRIVGVLQAAEDMRLHEMLPDDAERVFGLREFPLWYRTPRKALPAPPTRRALPWGDSAYTSAVYRRDLDGWPRATWVLGPVPGLTPSSEGPRRREAAEAAVVDRLIETINRRRRDA